ncbi:MAG: hypothetical protein ACK56I_15210, partial [bacterium]
RGKFPQGGLQWQQAGHAAATHVGLEQVGPLEAQRLQARSGSRLGQPRPSGGLQQPRAEGHAFEHAPIAATHVLLDLVAIVARPPEVEPQGLEGVLQVDPGRVFG